MTGAARSALHLAGLLEREAVVWLDCARGFAIGIGWTVAVALAVAGWLNHWPATLPAVALYAVAVTAAAGAAHQLAVWRAWAYRRKAQRLRAEAQAWGVSR